MPETSARVRLALLKDVGLQSAARLGGSLFAVTAVCIAVVAVLGHLPAPTTGEAAGQVAGSLFFVWFVACLSSTLTMWTTDPRYAITAGTIVAILVTTLAIL